MASCTFIAFSVALSLALRTIDADAAKKLEADEMAFLQNAAQEQLAEIALGKLAMKKASDKTVKEFGAEIVKDHQYASQEVKDLSAKEGIYLPVEMNGRQKKAQQRLSHLSGTEFDKAFIAFLLKEHRKHVEDLQKHATKLHSENVKQWADATEPILAVHLKKAEKVAETLRLK